jgi:hypothetical protein
MKARKKFEIISVSLDEVIQLSHGCLQFYFQTEIEFFDSESGEF